MEPKKIKQEAIQNTLMYIGKLPEGWVTFNDELHTFILDDEYKMKSRISLHPNELPILECVLQDSFVLITTDRVMSDLSGKVQEILLKETSDKYFIDEFEQDNYKKVNGQYPKTFLIALRGMNDKKLLFRIDSYYPASFAKLLITNLANYLKHGFWAWKRSSPSSFKSSAEDLK